MARGHFTKGKKRVTIELFVEEIKKLDELAAQLNMSRHSMLLLAIHEFRNNHPLDN